MFNYKKLKIENLAKKWKQKAIKFHTYTKKENKRRTYGLHNQIDIEDTKKDLELLAIMAIKINKMRGTTNLKYIVTVSHATNLK